MQTHDPEEGVVRVVMRDIGSEWVVPPVDMPAWPSVGLPGLPTEQSTWMRLRNPQIEELRDEIVALKEEISKLREELESRPVTKVAALYDLNSVNHSLREPLHIVIEEYDDETIAHFPELEVYGSGDSEPEAIARLKTHIIALYEELSTCDKGKLGKLPLSWLRILDKLVDRT